MKELEIKMIEQFLARLTTVRDGWHHKSKWNQELGSDFLTLYIEDYKDRLDKLLKEKDNKNFSKNLSGMTKLVYKSGKSSEECIFFYIENDSVINWKSTHKGYNEYKL